LNATELTVLPVVYQNVGVLKNYITEADPTVVNLRAGDALQGLRISVADEFGVNIPCGLMSGHPIELYAASMLLSGLHTPQTMPFNLFNSYHGFTTFFDNQLVTSMLKDEGEFFTKQRMNFARMDCATPITHYFEVVMF
jgi:hypothetical protein